MQCCVRSGAQSKSPVSVKVTDAGPYKRGESLMLIAVMELAAIYDAVKGKDNETYQNEEK